MKLSILIISLFVTIINLDIDEIRALYKQTDGSKENTIVLFNKLQSVSEKDGSVFMAYKGASIAMKGRFEKGAKQKSKIFKEGITIVESALIKEPKNMEIRFIRLSIQQNSPKILKYKKNIDEDKDFVLSNYESIRSNTLRNYIRDYILNSNHFTAEEKRVTSQP
ncbi:MAG: hypothetical protein QM478_01030 [Flavobacteriaceae bacterium]